MNDAAIKLTNVSKTFDDRSGRVEALRDIDLEIRRGEFFVFVGPSGCGKSTLLRIASGLDAASKGSVAFGRGLSARNGAFVFQQFALLPWLTVFSNVELNLLARAVPEAERKRRVGAELERLGLKEFAKARPRELSGGMKQRVGIARAFVARPEIIFMDEPFSELDTFTAASLRAELLEICRAEHPTVVMVSHNIAEAVELADTIAVMAPRPGRIERIIANDLPRPRQPRSEEFFRLEDKIASLVRP